LLLPDIAAIPIHQRRHAHIDAVALWCWADCL